MKLRKLKGLILALSTPALLFGCQKEVSQLPIDDFLAMNYIELYDYKSITIPKEDLFVSQDEIDSVILFDLQSRGYFINEKIRPVQYEDYVILDINEISNGVTETQKGAFVFVANDDNLSEAEQEFYENIVGMIPGESNSFSIVDCDEFGKNVVIKYEVSVLQIKSLVTKLSNGIVNDVYGFETIEETRLHFEKNIIEGRILDTVKTAVFENSTIKDIPKQKENYIEEMKMVIRNLSKEEGLTEDEYCYDKFEVNAQEYYDNISSFFDEYMIIKGISENEGYFYSEEDIEKVVSKIDSGENPEAEEYSFYYGLIGVLYSMRYDDIRNLLLEYAYKNIV